MASMSSMALDKLRYIDGREGRRVTSINVQLQMVCSPIANANRFTAPVSIKMIQLLLIQIRLPMNTIPTKSGHQPLKQRERHDGQQIEIRFFLFIGASQPFIHDFHNEFHKVVCFIGKSKADKSVNCKRTVSNPAISVIPIS